MAKLIIPRPPRSPIERDTEVADFLRMILPTRTYSDAVAECLARFGPSRTPSRSAVHKYAERLARKAAGGA